MENFIEIKRLRKVFGKNIILKNLNLVSKQGTMTCIMGSSGSGKTTLLNIAGSLDTPTAGQINIGGANILTLSQNQLCNYRNIAIGFVFQFHYLIPELTILENVCLPNWFSKKKNKKIRRDAMQLLDFLGIDSIYDRRPSSISGGEQQRVAVARSLINQPKVVLADEPTGNLDEANTENIIDLLKKVNQELQQTILVVTHNAKFKEICDHSYMLEQGVLSPITNAVK